MEYCYWKSCWRALFEVKWIIRNYQDLSRVRVSGDLSLLVDNKVHCSELAPLLSRLY